MPRIELAYPNVAALDRAARRFSMNNMAPLVETYGLPLHIAFVWDGCVGSVFSMDYREGDKKPLIVRLDYWDHVDVTPPEHPLLPCARKPTVLNGRKS
jgi:hypothetical protein